MGQVFFYPYTSG